MKNKYAVLFACIFLFSSILLAQENESIWTKVSKNKITQTVLQRSVEPTQASYYKMNISELTAQLANAPIRGVSSGISNTIIQLPSGDGTLQLYRIKEAPIFEPELQAHYSNIRSYVGTAVSNKNLVVRFSVTPHGFHAMFLNSENGTIYIDPFTEDKSTFVVYARKELPVVDQDFLCEVESSMQDRSSENASRVFNDGNLRTFRLALACTGEYGVFHGGTVPLAEAAMAVTMTRVNGIFENDLSVTMQIVATNSNVVFVDPVTDPFTGNNNANVLINESQSVIDANILNANYDIGHTFSTGAGGLASLNAPCNTGLKARGVTGLSSPVGDVFDVDFVSHEIGHQFGANHTFNGDAGNCAGANRNDPTAVEPGSGSTIMAYAGICTPQNVQNNSDAYFHIVSLQEMWTNITNAGAGGANCAAQSATGNSSPTINALTSYSIPKSTPFVLKGNGSDPDGNGSLTFCWEQMDNEIVAIPPSSTETTGANFRSVMPSVATDRYMPALTTVITGNTASTWEVVPDVARDLNFNLTVRDNDVSGGRYATSSMTVSTIDIIPFKVTAPMASVVWGVGTTKTITWDVGSSTGAPINVANVNIKLSTDGGLTYPITILSNTPNDGTQNITIPNNLSTTCRIMVESVGNIFYNINPVDFTIDTVDGETNYCPSTFAFDPSEFVSNVTFNTIDNTSGNAASNGYEDFTAVSTDVEINTTHQLDVTINTAGNFTDYCEVYIDWNKDYIFDPITEYYDLGSVTNVSAGVLSANITVPAGANIGTTRMRVTIQDLPNPGPCFNDHGSGYGETEDYTLNVTNILSINDNKFKHFSLYPNPSNGNFTLTFKTESTEKIQLKLFDVLGRTLTRQIFNPNNILFNEQLQFSNLSKGTYFLRITQGQTSTSKQLTIK